MSNNQPQKVLVTSEWSTLKALAHPLRRELLKKCWEQPRSVGELAELLAVNPGTILYHMRRLEKVGLVYLEETEKKRGIIEKRYRSQTQQVSVQPPAAEATVANLVPLVSMINAAVHTINPAAAAQGQNVLVGHIAEARISLAQQQEISRRLAELAQYIDSLPDDPAGTPMRLATIFGPSSSDSPK